MSRDEDRTLTASVEAPVDLVVQIGKVVVELDPGHALPDVPAVPLLGRAAELARLDAAAGRPGVLVSGPSGSGTTSLALHWAARTGDVLRVDLHGPVEPPSALRRALIDLGVPPTAVPGDPAARAALFRSLLAGRSTVVVLDGAADEEQVRALAPGTGRVVATSARPLPGLAVDGWAHVPLGGLPAAAGAALLLTAHPDGPGWADPGAVRRLVERCAGLPATLQLLAGTAPTVDGPAQVLDLMAAGHTAHELAVRALPPEERAALQEVLDTGGVDLGPALLSALGVPDARAMLRGWATRGLVRDLGGDRYRVPALLRTERGAPHPPVTVHEPPGAAQAPGIAGDEHDDLHGYVTAAAALRRAGDAGGEAAVQLRLAARLVTDGRPAAALDHATRALQLSAEVGDDRGRGLAQSGIAAALVGTGDAGGAIDLYDRALRLLTDALDPDDPDLGWTHLGRGNALAALDREPDSRTAAAAAAAVFEAAGHHPGSVRAGLAIVESHLREGSTGEALAACRRLLAVEPATAALVQILDGRLTAQVRDGTGFAALTTAARPAGGEVGDAVRRALGTAGAEQQLLALLAVHDGTS